MEENALEVSKGEGNGRFLCQYQHRYTSSPMIERAVNVEYRKVVSEGSSEASPK